MRSSLLRVLVQQSVLAVQSKEGVRWRKTSLRREGFKVGTSYIIQSFYSIILILSYPLLSSRAQVCFSPPTYTPAFPKCSTVYYSGLSGFFYSVAAPQFRNAFASWTYANFSQNNSQVNFVEGTASAYSVSAVTLNLVSSSSYNSIESSAAAKFAS